MRKSLFVVAGAVLGSVLLAGLVSRVSARSPNSNDNLVTECEKTVDGGSVCKDQYQTMVLEPDGGSRGAHVDNWPPNLTPDAAAGIPTTLSTSTYQQEEVLCGLQPDAGVDAGSSNSPTCTPVPTFAGQRTVDFNNKLSAVTVYVCPSSTSCTTLTGTPLLAGDQWAADWGDGACCLSGGAPQSAKAGLRVTQAK
jgi:hypothetical protein